MADEDLRVDPQAVSNYGWDVFKQSMTAGMPISTKLSTVEVDSSGAFSGLSGFDAGIFAEGPVMQAAMEKQSYAFSAFVADMTRGLMAIGNAANVCAHAYNAGDVESAEKMNLLGYAFATDPDAKAPPGMPKSVTGETLLDLAMKNQGGEQPEVLSNPNGGTTAQVYGSGWLTTYSDGSSKMVHSEPVPGVPGASMAVTTLTGPNGQVISTTTTRTKYSADGTSSEYYRKEVRAGAQTEGADGKTQKMPDTTVTTETSPAADGGKVITQTTQVGDKDPEVRTQKVDPLPAQTNAIEDGPLQKAQEELGPDAGKVDWRKGYQGVKAPG
ncbi:hypothetical protein [Cryptosporangium minutisporangium]|uniref:Uncharacterized protein n=1 Tax=Cryptosporangium minutisporangium TaxID=113569 RepID=A0ABP6TC38_9ACTN